MTLNDNVIYMSDTVPHFNNVTYDNLHVYNRPNDIPLRWSDLEHDLNGMHSSCSLFHIRVQ
jgi:hypothetical protein